MADLELTENVLEEGQSSNEAARRWSPCSRPSSVASRRLCAPHALAIWKLVACLGGLVFFVVLGFVLYSRFSEATLAAFVHPAGSKFVRDYRTAVEAGNVAALQAVMKEYAVEVATASEPDKVATGPESEEEPPRYPFSLTCEPASVGESYVQQKIEKLLGSEFENADQDAVVSRMKLECMIGGMEIRMVKGHWYFMDLLHRSGFEELKNLDLRYPWISFHTKFEAEAKSKEIKRMIEDFPGPSQAVYRIGFRGIYSLTGETKHGGFSSFSALTGLELELWSTASTHERDLLALRSHDNVAYAHLLAFQLCTVAPHVLRTEVELLRGGNGAVVKVPVGRLVTVSVKLSPADLIDPVLIREVRGCGVGKDARARTVLDIEIGALSLGTLRQMCRVFQEGTGFAHYSIGDRYFGHISFMDAVLGLEGEDEGDAAIRADTEEHESSFAAVRMVRAAAELLAVDHAEFDENKHDWLARACLTDRIRDREPPVLRESMPWGDDGKAEEQAPKQVPALPVYTDAVLQFVRLSRSQVPVVLDTPLQGALSEADGFGSAVSAAVSGAPGAPGRPAWRRGHEFWLCSLLVLEELLAAGLQPQNKQWEEAYIGAMRGYLFGGANDTVEANSTPLDFVERLRKSKLLLQIRGRSRHDMESLRTELQLDLLQSPQKYVDSFFPA